MSTNESNSASVLLGGDQLKCGVCEVTCDSVMKFLQHKIMHVDRGNGRGCEVCQLGFSRQTALYEHYRRKHNIVFDTTLEKPDVQVERLKNRVKGTAKKVRGKSKIQLETGVSLLDSATEQIETTAAISLPNGLSCNVNLGYSNSFVDNIDKLHEATKVNEPTTLVSAESLASSYHTQNVSCISSESVVYNKTIVPGSSLLVSSPTLSGSVNLTSSSVILVMGPPTGSALTSVSSTQSDERLPLTESPSSSSLNDLLQSNYSHNNQDNEKVVKHFYFDKSSDLDRKQTTYVESFHKPVSHNRTEAYRQVVPGKKDQKTASLNGVSSITDSYVANKIDLFTGEISHSSQKDSLQTIVPLTNEQIGNQENFSNECIDSLKESEVENSKTDEINKKDHVVTRNVSPSKSLAYCTRNFKKRGKLAPVPGKIPQELDMPDFYFIYFVTKGGKNVKSMHVGKDQFNCLFCTYVVRWRNSMCRHMREDHDKELLSGAALITPLHLDTENGKLMKMTEYIALETAEKPNKRMRGVETQDMLGEYPCEQCGKVFNRLRYWRMHLQSHKRNKDFLCALCSKTFKTQRNLIQHLKSHEEKEPYKCPECDFESAVNIAIHKHRQIHSGNSLICEICGQAYSDKSTLKKHKQVHDPARPFGCSIAGCTWRFRSKVMCDAHIQGHGSKRTFKCEVCGYAFRQKHHLQRHEKVVHNIVHEPKPSYTYYSNRDQTEFNQNHFEDISNDGQNEMEVSQGVNLIINEGNMSNVITADHFDLESALQNGQLVIATDNSSINYEMSDIGSNVVYQTLLPDGEAQQFEAQTICIPQADASQMVYEEVETIQSEVEIEQS